MTALGMDGRSVSTLTSANAVQPAACSVQYAPSRWRRAITSRLGLPLLVNVCWGSG